MTLPMGRPSRIPELTEKIARKAFPKGNVYMRMRDELGEMYKDEDFQDLYGKSGGWAESPGRLALVSIMQYAENLTDRQAADAVRGRIDWKYALGLEISDAGFDYSVLSEFRARLVEGGAEQRVLERMLEVYRERGLLKARGRQRTDTTHVLGAVRDVNRLELVGETLRHVLEALAVVAPEWLQSWVPAEWQDRYAARMDDYRLPKGQSERERLAETIGGDGYELLRRVYECGLAQAGAGTGAGTGMGAGAGATGWSWLRQLPAVEVMRRIWVQQYEWRDDDGRAYWRKSGDLPPGADIIHSPYDLDVRYSSKRNTHWVGYKVGLTETCDEDTPNLIVHVTTTPATTADDTLITSVHAALADKDLLPTEHYVDAGFVNAQALVDSQTEHGVEVIGPARPDTTWQARQAQGFDVSAFEIDWAAQRSTCPQGKTSRSWSPSHDTFGKETIHIQFARQDCLACPCQLQCTRTQQVARTLHLRAPDSHLALQARRQYQTTPDFKRRYARRAGIEGCIAQGLAVADLRHARYIGLAKTRLQHILTAAALNIGRAVRWLAGVPKARTRVSHFARLTLAVTPAL